MLGRLIGRIMAKETASANEHALRLLGLVATDHVLEVGFGPGRTVALAAAAVPRGFVAGVDLSEAMLRMAARRNRHHIAAGRVALEVSNGVPLPFPGAAFDKACCVHVLYFWPEPRDPLLQVYRVLKPGGRFVLGFRERSDPHTADFPPGVYRFYERADVESLLADCGFRVTGSEVATDGTVFLIAAR